MEDDDKPFECPYCDMRFVSEDRLSVHKERHNFRLNLSASTPKISLLSNDISDQTPTPTRFIKNCDEVGLFTDDLPNPFDEQFRRASQTSNDVLINISQPNCESLNTPYIPIYTSEILLKQNSHNEYKKKVSGKLPLTEADSDTNPFPIISLATTKITETDKGSVATSVIATKSKSMTVAAPIKNENSGQTSVITSVGIKQKILGKPTAVVVKPANNPATLKTVLTKPAQIAPSINNTGTTTEIPTTQGQGSVLQLILKLPDGQSMPFNIPVVPTNTVGQNVVAVAAPSAGTSTITAPSTKIKLKDTIEQQISIKNSTGQTFGGSIVKPRNLASNISYGVSSIPVLPNICAVTNQNVATVVPTVRTVNSNSAALGVKRQKEEVEDEAEKRRKFLERNRAAANRCRKKRKREYEDMKNKANDLTKTNEQLQGMVAMLRKEVAQLKTVLLAHKDCPVTQQQISTGQNNIFSLTSLNAANIQLNQATSFSLNPTFQTITGLTSNDGGGMELESIESVRDDASQLSSNGNMDSLIGVESSDDSGPFLPTQDD